MRQKPALIRGLIVSFVNKFGHNVQTKLELNTY